jgi:hypothetical protein
VPLLLQENAGLYVRSLYEIVKDDPRLLGSFFEAIRTEIPAEACQAILKKPGDSQSLALKVRVQVDINSDILPVLEYFLELNSPEFSRTLVIIVGQRPEPHELSCDLIARLNHDDKNFDLLTACAILRMAKAKTFDCVHLGGHILHGWDSVQIHELSVSYPFLVIHDFQVLSEFVGHERQFSAAFTDHGLARILSVAAELVVVATALRNWTFDSFLRFTRLFWCIHILRLPHVCVLIVTVSYRIYLICSSYSISKKIFSDRFSPKFVNRRSLLATIKKFEGMPSCSEHLGFQLSRTPRR